MKEVFGLKKKVIERVSAIQDSVIKEVSDCGVKSIDILWGGRDFYRGAINIEFSGGVDKRGRSTRGSSVITTFYEARKLGTSLMNPMGGLSAILTVIANINEFSLGSGGEKHLVVAN